MPFTPERKVTRTPDQQEQKQEKEEAKNPKNQEED